MSDQAILTDSLAEYIDNKEEFKEITINSYPSLGIIDCYASNLGSKYLYVVSLSLEGEFMIIESTYTEHITECVDLCDPESFDIVAALTLERLKSFPL